MGYALGCGYVVPVYYCMAVLSVQIHPSLITSSFKIPKLLFTNPTGIVHKPMHDVTVATSIFYIQSVAQTT